MPAERRGRTAECDVESANQVLRVHPQFLGQDAAGLRRLRIIPGASLLTKALALNTS